MLLTSLFITWHRNGLAKKLQTAAALVPKVVGFSKKCSLAFLQWQDKDGISVELEPDKELLKARSRPLDVISRDRVILSFQTIATVGDVGTSNFNSN